MEQGDFFSLETQFKNLIPNITYQNTLSYLYNQGKVLVGTSQSRQPLTILKTIDIPLKLTLMTVEQTPKYIIVATCLVENSVMSTVTIHMLSKGDPERRLQKKLKSIYMQITALKFSLDFSENLILIAGTSCGRLLLYRGFEQGSISVECFRFSPHSVVDLITPSFRGSLFVLTSNATIYLIDTNSKLIHYQFQCQLPHLEDSKLFLFMDSAEKYICCAFSYGRIIVWEITSKMKTQFEQEKLNLSKDKNVNSKWLKKQGKEKVSRNIIFKPKVNLLCCVEEGIQWINFFGTFIGVVTSSHVFKVMAIDFCSHLENTELYLTLSDFSLIPFEHRENYHSTIYQIQKCEIGIIVGLNLKPLSSTFCQQRSFSQIIIYQFFENYEVKTTKMISLDDSVLEHYRDSSSRIYVCRLKESLRVVELAAKVLEY